MQLAVLAERTAGVAAAILDAVPGAIDGGDDQVASADGQREPTPGGYGAFEGGGVRPAHGLRV
jgi:hypothetical protein